MDSAPEVDLSKPSRYDFDMDRRSVERIGALLGHLPSKWTLAGQVEEDGIEAERAKRKWTRLRRQTAKRAHGQRLANRLIYKNHKRRSIVRLMKKGLYAPGRRYNRFRPLEAIRVDRKAICEFWGFPAKAKDIAKACGIDYRKLGADLRWLQENGYLERVAPAEPTLLITGKHSLGLWDRTSKPFEGYEPDVRRAAIYRNKAMTDDEREAVLKAEIQAAIERQEGRSVSLIQNRDGKAVAPMKARRRRLPPADYARIKANREAKRARSTAGIRQG
jgi:hypothetical protein